MSNLAPFVEQNFTLTRNPNGSILKQWVSEIDSFSSEYTSSGNWRATEIIGPPKVFPNYGDRSGAWAPGRFNNMEFVVVKFPKPVQVAHLNIYETNIPGAVCRISARGPGNQWVILWQGEPNHTLPLRSRIFRPPLTETVFSNVIKVELNCMQLNTWPEIDCIELVGHSSCSRTPLKRNLIETDLKRLFDSRHLFSDITFIVENQEIKAHKCILWSRSEVFKAMLTSHMSENLQNTIEIKDFAYDVFLQFLEYLYTGGVDIKDNNILALYCAADKYDFPQLRNLCVQELQQCLTTENVSQVLYAVSKMGDLENPLVRACVQFIKDHSSVVICSSSFASLPKEVILCVTRFLAGESMTSMSDQTEDLERFVWTSNTNPN